MTIKDLKDKELILFECISGSKAYGLDTATSDTDMKGVFYLPKKQFYGLDYVEQVNNDTNDEVYYELGRFIDLLIKNNPNLLELLATPSDCILYKHPVMEQINLDMFLSKLCKDTFAGYAITQIKKARGYKKKVVNPVDRERQSVLDFCYIIIGHSSILLKEWLTENYYKQEYCGLVSIPHTKNMYAVFYDETHSFCYRGVISSLNANEVSLSSIPKGEKEKACMFFNLEAYSSYCKEYKEYWEWMSKRNEERYRNNMAHGKNYDAKNMMHTIRLLQVAEEILQTGRLNVRRSNREELLSIKAGNWEYKDLLEKADEIIQKIEEVSLTSSLSERPNREEIENILVGMRTKLYE